MERVWIVVGIIVNLFLPGLGTVIMGKWLSGLIQLGLIGAIWLIGLVTFGIGGFILAPVHLLVWLWALLGGIWELALATGRAQRNRWIF
ncbi:MAG: hypothetical protein K6U87_13540 [Firmicutes bacterium]|nr:hypothetical protein [Bacillota bacterium]